MHKDMTQTASARQAGYSNPSVDAVRLLRNEVAGTISRDAGGKQKSVWCNDR